MHCGDFYLAATDQKDTQTTEVAMIKRSSLTNEWDSLPTFTSIDGVFLTRPDSATIIYTLIVLASYIFNIFTFDLIQVLFLLCTLAKLICLKSFPQMLIKPSYPATTDVFSQL